VRALNLLFTLQREQKVMVFENKKDSEIAREIARELEVEIEIPTGQAEAEEPNEYTVINNEYPILYLMNRARRNGYDLFVNLAEGSDTPTLFFGKSTAADMEFSIEWGKSLLQFSPTLKTKEQVSKVTVRGWDPSKTGDDRSIVGEATWADLDIEMPDPQLLANINTALAQSHEEVTDQPILNQQQAEDMAAGILRGIAQGLVTGRGATVGFPELRAGRKVHIEGLGLRYSGIYRITETTHTIGNAGYTTQFSARMEVIGD
jgi:phage protein D